ncbi:MAG: Ig-like domain-containing protein [Flavobacterium sp.]|nr:Ig-like domain-containing protein [Flavobacterium sp.]
MKKINVLFALLCLVVMSCNPSDDNDSNSNLGSDFSKNFGAVASRDFIGQVVDMNNLPIQNVSVKIGTSTVQTDVNGVFIINGANVYEKFAYITAKKAGYIDGSRSMIPTSGKNNVKIMMMPSTPIATIQSGVSSEVALPSGTKVVFDGAFETEAGVAYTGSVAVSMFHLTSSDENIGSLMPGMLFAQAADGSAKVSETLGMMEVALRGSGGEKLQIAKTHSAQISMPIDASQLAIAPSTIPLLHFDEVNGYWKEEGSATKVGNQYVGTVSHFSWWDFAASFPPVSLTVKVVDVNGNPISNANVVFSFWLSPSIGLGAGGSTDNNGQFSMIVPANNNLTLQVFAPSISCVSNNILYSSAVGPYSTNSTLPDIVLNSITAFSSSNVLGTLVKCDNALVTNGYVVLNKYLGQSIFPVTNGAFNFNDIYCVDINQFTLQGFDFDNLLETGVINYTFTSPTTAVGNLIACSSVLEYISFQIDSDPVVYCTTNMNGTIDGNAAGQLLVSGQGPNSTEYISGNVNTPGIYDGNQFHIEGNPLSIFGTTSNNIQFNLSHVGAVGDYIDMTFSGTYDDYVLPGVTHTLTGVVHVIRDN